MYNYNDVDDFEIKFSKVNKMKMRISLFILLGIFSIPILFASQSEKNELIKNIGGNNQEPFDPKIGRVYETLLIDAHSNMYCISRGEPNYLLAGGNHPRGQRVAGCHTP